MASERKSQTDLKGANSESPFKVKNMKESTATLMESSFASLNLDETTFSIGSSTFIKRVDGVYAYGKNESGELGLGTWDQNIKVPTKIKAFEDVEIIDIKGGKKHVMFLDATGLIWSAGENLEGQLGLIEDIERANCPMIAPLDAKIVKIKCDKNGHSSYAIDDLGKFYCCGLIQANKDDAPRRQLMFQKSTFSDALSK